MQKIIFSFMAVLASLSINAQTVKVYDNGSLTATYNNSVSDKYKVILDMVSVTTGETQVSESAGITDNKVKWVQLWKDGPCWAVLNVGAKSASEYGEYYCWGSTNTTDYSKSTTDIQGTTDDTAMNLWGDNWQMPTNTDFINLLSTTYTDGGVWKSADESGYGIAGLLVTGKDDYSSNSVFFPASGFYSKYDGLICQGESGNYWASSLHDPSANAHELYFSSSQKFLTNESRRYGLFVRPVLKQSNNYTPAIKVYKNDALTATYGNSSDHQYRAMFMESPAPVSGTAKATINGSEVDVDWVQLWKGGPKFATKDVGASGTMSMGNFYTFSEVYSVTWGGNWKIMESDDLCDLVLTDKVTRSFIRDDNNNYFFKFTGKEDYQNNSIYFFAEYSREGDTEYWNVPTGDSGNNHSSSQVIYDKDYDDEDGDHIFLGDDQVWDGKAFVRMVLKE